MSRLSVGSFSLVALLLFKENLDISPLFDPLFAVAFLVLWSALMRHDILKAWRNIGKFRRL